ncbi:protein-disulfide reductase DsbD domain-containing protein [Dyadobacter sp. CY356]|uniref:protein-disulfide reductase DsbD domain-containing protein n=1 Tax=Dyadobacter sp. CY356 TaxID=2906442 RepID=UPI001F3D4870|nr:protein-disulfide reductase DsbD domain-containing protein [Dyadobacter sp. CY356]MCF0055304.1 protein-disulfide reductase DsbD N-terminal domain-containing protein [Dyadobacter sp. CY356]
MKYINLIVFFLSLSTLAFGQKDKEISKWKVSVSNNAAKSGQEIEVIFFADIDKNWKLYSSDFKGDIGPLPTTFVFEKNEAYKLVGDITPVEPKKTIDPTWDVAYTYFTEKAQFRQKIKLVKKDFIVKGTIKGLLCSSVDGICVPFEESFQVN